MLLIAYVIWAVSNFKASSECINNVAYIYYEGLISYRSHLAPQLGVVWKSLKITHDEAEHTHTLALSFYHCPSNTDTHVHKHACT